MTPVRVISNVLPFLNTMNEGSLRFAKAHKTRPESVALLAAICLRETWAGEAPGYRPHGSPDGTGDWCVRRGGWLRRAGVRIYQDGDRDALRASGWSIPKGEGGQTVPGPYAVPSDGLGWGRGYWQLDILGDVRDLIAPEPWPVDQQAAAACAQLHQNRLELAPYQLHPLFEQAIVARYNANLDRVRAGLTAGNVDVGTTGGDYSKDVFALRDALLAKYPEKFPTDWSA